MSLEISITKSSITKTDILRKGTCTPHTLFENMG